MLHRAVILTLLGLLVAGAASCGGGGMAVSPAPAASTRQLTITTTQLQSGTKGSAYACQLTAQGGAPPLTWSVAMGSPPPGVTLNSQTGILSGTPAKVGTFTMTIEATDSTFAQQQTALASLTMNVGTPPLAIVTPAIPSGVVGMPYAVTLQASGGIPPYMWSVIAGDLPPGLQLDPMTGKIAGMPMSPGNSEFTIQVTDSSSPQNIARLIIAAPNPGE